MDGGGLSGARRWPALAWLLQSNTRLILSVCVCVCTSEAFRGLFERWRHFSKLKHMHPFLCSVLSSFNPVKLFQLCQGFAPSKAIDCMANSIRPYCCSTYWVYAVIQWHWGDGQAFWDGPSECIRAFVLSNPVFDIRPLTFFQIVLDWDCFFRVIMSL